MYLLIADETNQQCSVDAQFFVYGALFFPIEKLPNIDEGIRNIRNKFGYRSNDVFKFDTRSRPDHISIPQCTEAKSAILDLCREMDCKFIVHVILHEIMRHQPFDVKCYWAADYVFGRFNTFLTNETRDCGICIIDTLSTQDQYKYLTDKFSVGLTIQPSGRVVPLSKIKMFGTSSLGACNANSAMDIVLGSFRYCINNPRNPQAAKTMMGKVMDLLWHKKSGDTIYALDRGLSIRPKINQINNPEYKQKYIDLINHINDLIRDN